MVAEDLAFGQLDGDVIAAFAEAHRVKGRFAAVVARGSRSLLIYLRELGVVGPEGDDPVTPLGMLIAEYRQWLISDRGLAPLTVTRYVALATRFLVERVAMRDELGMGDLSDEHVTAFPLRECERLAVDSAKGRVGELRSLFEVPVRARVDTGGVGRRGSAGRELAGHRDSTRGQVCGCRTADRVV